jgi:hypothetical protein
MRTHITRFVLLAIAAALFVAVGVRFMRRSPRSSGLGPPPEIVSEAAAAETVPGTATSPATPKAPAPAASAAASSSPRAQSIPTPVPLAKAAPRPPTPDDPAMLEIDRVSLMIRDYRTLAGENPVGTNAEIMAALMGDNPKHARLGPPDGARLNEKGELLDRWGTPYFFHQLSRDHMEIRSAGEDKVMWTEDDPIIN